MIGEFNRYTSILINCLHNQELQIQEKKRSRILVSFQECVLNEVQVSVELNMLKGFEDSV